MNRTVNITIIILLVDFWAVRECLSKRYLFSFFWFSKYYIKRMKTYVNVVHFSFLISKSNWKCLLGVVIDKIYSKYRVLNIDEIKYWNWIYLATSDVGKVKAWKGEDGAKTTSYLRFLFSTVTDVSLAIKDSPPHMELQVFKKNSVFTLVFIKMSFLCLCDIHLRLFH